MEVGVDLRFGRLWPHGPIADFERQSRLVEIEQRRGDHLALAPPAIGTDHGGAIVRREAQQHRRLIDAAGATGVLDPGKQQARIVAERRGNSPQQRRAHGRASGLDASLGQRQNVGTGKRRGAGGGADVTGVDQAVGAIFVIVLLKRSAEVAQDDALGQGVEIAVAPQGADDLRRLVAAPRRFRRVRRGDLSRTRLRLAAGEKLGDLRRSLGMRGQFGFLALANPAAAWPGRMGLEEGGERGEGRMGVGAQGRPFQRRSPAASFAAWASAARPADVAPIVEDRGLRTERRRRRGRVWRGGRSGWGRRNRGEGADDGPGAWDVGISELRREGGAARSGLLARRRELGGGICTNAASRAHADRAAPPGLGSASANWAARSASLNAASGGGGGWRRAGRWPRNQRRRSVHRRRSAARQPPAAPLDRRRRLARAASSTRAAEEPMALLVDRRQLGGRPARLRGERNQASAGADGEKKARMENRHGSNPLRRGWTNFADQDLNLGPRRAAPFAWDAPELCVGRLAGAMD